MLTAKYDLPRMVVLEEDTTSHFSFGLNGIKEHPIISCSFYGPAKVPEGDLQCTQDTTWTYLEHDFLMNRWKLASVGNERSRSSSPESIVFT